MTFALRLSVQVSPSSSLSPCTQKCSAKLRSRSMLSLVTIVYPQSLTLRICPTSRPSFEKQGDGITLSPWVSANGLGKSYCLLCLIASYAPSFNGGRHLQGNAYSSRNHGDAQHMVRASHVLAIEEGYPDFDLGMSFMIQRISMTLSPSNLNAISPPTASSTQRPP